MIQRVAFAGTPEFAAVALRDLLAAGFEVPLILTQPDRPAGRGLKLQPSPVKQLALAHGLGVIQPRSLRLDGKFPDDAAAARAALQQAGIEVMVVAAYGLILPPWVLALPPRGCLNIHASLLPRWRGAAPIHRAIEAGDATTGITIMQMDAGLDTGPMLLWQAEAIRPDDSTGSLHDRLAALGGRLVVQALQAPALPAVPQPEAGVTYAHKVEKAEARIRWDQPAAQIERRVRAFDPFPGCSFERAGESIKLWRAAVVAGDAVPGTCLAAAPGRIVVACGAGALELLELQRPGGRRQPASALALKCEPGQPISPGMSSGLRPLLSILALVAGGALGGCDLLGVETLSQQQARRAAEGKAVGSACRHAGRAIEDCYTLNKKADKAAVFAGWREMNDYMTENKIEVMPPTLPSPESLAAKDEDEDHEPAPPAKAAAPAKGGGKSKAAHGG